MGQSVDLLFFNDIDKTSFGSFSEKVHANKDDGVSGNSFKEILTNLKAGLQSLDNDKNKEEELKDDEELVFLTNSLNLDILNLESDQAVMGALVGSLIASGTDADSDVACQSVSNCIMIMAPSIKNEIAYQPMLSENVLDELETVADTVLSKNAKENIGIGHSLPVETVENVSPESKVKYNSSIRFNLDDITRYTELQPKQIMSLMQTAGLVKQVEVSHAENITVDTAVKEDNTELDIKPQNSNSISVSPNDEIPVNMEGNSLQDSDSFNDMFSPSNRLNLASAEIFRTSESSHTLDFTSILDQNNPADNLEIIRKLADKISMSLRGNKYEMELQIKPEYLGRLVLKFTLEDGVLSGRIYTTSQQSRDILQNNLGSLKVALEEQGYTFSQLDVNVGNQDSTGQFQYPYRERTDTRMGEPIIDLFDEIMDDKTKFVNNYTGSSEIDYFA